MKRMRPMIIIMGLSFFLLFGVNSILAFIDASFSSAYVDNVSGQASISPESENSFTLFGSEALLVGEYLIPPVFDDYERLNDALNETTGEEELLSSTLPVVSSAAQLKTAGQSSARSLFGVDFDSYASFFPHVQLVHGSYPHPGTSGILIQKNLYDQFVERSGKDSLIGEPVTLTVAYESSFTIREVPLAGVYEYPVDDDLLNRVALVDADTARGLNGYVYGASETSVLEDSQQGLIDSSVDDLFASPQPDSAVTDETGSTASADGILSEIDSLFSNNESIAESARPVSNAWNFVLLRFAGRVSETRGVQRIDSLLAQKMPEIEHDVRDWRRSIGGNVLIVWFLRILINIGIIFVIVGASSVSMNAIVLSVLERKNEIGTMRAMGAPKSKVATLISYEVGIVILGSALLGIVLSVAGVGIVNSLQPRPDNYYLQLLFGGSSIRGQITSELLVFHIGAALLVSVISLIYPLKKILGLSPVRAMQ